MFSGACGGDSTWGVGLGGGAAGGGAVSQWGGGVNADEGVSRAGEGERDLGRVGDVTMH